MRKRPVDRPTQTGAREMATSSPFRSTPQDGGLELLSFTPFQNSSRECLVDGPSLEGLPWTSI